MRESKTMRKSLNGGAPTRGELGAGGVHPLRDRPNQSESKSPGSIPKLLPRSRSRETSAHGRVGATGRRRCGRSTRAMTTTSLQASSGELVGAEAATKMLLKRGPAENGIRSPLAPRWVSNVVVASTTYPSEMEKMWGKAAMAFWWDWVTSTQTHAMYPGSGPSCGGNTLRPACLMYIMA